MLANAIKSNVDLHEENQQVMEEQELPSEMETNRLMTAGAERRKMKN